MAPHRELPHSSTLPLHAYPITQNGFLPSTPPLARLPNKYFEPWEAIIADLPSLLKTSNIRPCIDALPVLSLSSLETEAEWQRAFLVLAIMAQGYIWSGEQPSEVSARLLTPLRNRFTALTVMYCSICLHQSASRSWQRPHI